MATVGESVAELREDIPLKTGKRTSRWFTFNDDCFGGSKFINICFGVLTAGITVALLIQIYYGDYQVIPHGSVATDSKECSEIGTSILKSGGNSVDAAIASTFCLAVVKPHLTGLDAQGQILIYNHRLQLTPDFIDFSRVQRQSTLLPRLVIGLAFIHRQYGLLPWRDLVVPAAQLARKGFLVSNTLALSIANEHMKNIYGPLEAGHIMTLEALAETLQTIANIEEEVLYNEIDSTNSPIQSQAINSTFNRHNIYVPSAPSVGPSLLVNLQHIEQMNFTSNSVGLPDFVIRVADVTEAIYEALNVSTEYHNGTSSNVAVIDTNEQYVSLITGMYAQFGSKELTVGGYLLDLPLENRPLCTRLPIIITNSDYICGRRLVLGANNVALATQVITNLLIANENATVAIEAPRFNLINKQYIGLEESHRSLYNDEVVQQLEKFWQLISLKEPYDSCNIVEKNVDDLNSHSDSREGGISSRF